MDQYKQDLCCAHFGDDCKGEEDILRCIVENKYNCDFTYNLNANGKLHSRYLEDSGCYEPAIICRCKYIVYLYWLFDGEIKDCLHPFVINIDKEVNGIDAIVYYSLERILQLQPIYLNYGSALALYNRFAWGSTSPKIIDDPNIPSHSISGIHKHIRSQFIMIAPYVICPLWPDEFASNSGLFKFKFED